MRAVCHGSGLVFGLENLAEVVLRKDHCVLLVGSVQRGIAHIKQISAQRQVRAMFLQNAERQQACALGLLNSATKVRGPAAVNSSQWVESLACGHSGVEPKNKTNEISSLRMGPSEARILASPPIGSRTASMSAKLACRGRAQVTPVTILCPKIKL